MSSSFTDKVSALRRFRIRCSSPTWSNSKPCSRSASTSRAAGAAMKYHWLPPSEASGGEPEAISDCLYYKLVDSYLTSQPPYLHSQHNRFIDWQSKGVSTSELQCLQNNPATKACALERCKMPKIETREILETRSKSPPAPYDRE